MPPSSRSPASSRSASSPGWCAVTSADPIDVRALDNAWTAHRDGQLRLADAITATVAGGVTYAEARALLDAPHQPSDGYLVRSA